MSWRRLVPLVLPLAWGWACCKRAHALRTGTALLPHEMDVARLVGVVHPERIRVVRFERSPFPWSRLADGLAAVFHLPSTQVNGLSLGYALFIECRTRSLRLLAHECRHTQQFEAAGSLWRFLAMYLRQVARHGYAEAPCESDARAAAAEAVPHEQAVPPERA